MDFENLNRAFNIETGRVEDIETNVPPLFTRGTKNQKRYILKQSGRRGGRGDSYPWRDPEYQVGDWFWKPVHKSDWDKNLGRPNIPPSRKVAGRVWRSSKAYREDTKQYGYYVERMQ